MSTENKKTIYVSEGKITNPFEAASRVNEPALQDPDSTDQKIESEGTQDPRKIQELPSLGGEDVMDPIRVQPVGSEEEETESGDDSDDQGDDDAEGEDDIPNPYYLLYKQFSKDGFTQEDPDLDEEKVDAGVLYNKVRTDLTEKLRPQIEQQLLAELQQQYNLTPENIQQMMLINQGYDPRQVIGANAYRALSEMNDEVSNDRKEQAIRQMYSERGLSLDEVETMVNTAKDNDRIDDLFDSARSFFKGRYQDLKSQEAAAAAEIQHRNDAIRENNRRILDKVLTKRKLGEVELSPQEAQALNDAFYTQDQTVTIKGNEHKATRWQVFQHKLQTDVEFLISLFKQEIFKDSMQKRVKEEALKEVDGNFLSAYKKSVEKQIKGEKAKTKKQLNTDPNLSNKKVTHRFGF